MKRKRGLAIGLASSVAVASVITLSAVAPGQHGVQVSDAAQVNVASHRDIHPAVRNRNVTLAQEEALGGDCVLTVPANPLTAQGLATPYQLSNGPNTADCTMANSANLGAFVEATIVAPNGDVFGYSPLVVTAGTLPAAPPPLPNIPQGSVITIDTAFAGNILFLQGPGAGVFNQGLPGSPFGQVSFANGPAFFAAARSLVKVPPLGMASDGMPCPTVRDFSLVDQDPSDNVNTQYLLTAGGLTAEAGSGVAGTPIGVGSDNHLLTGFVDPALNCLPFAVPSLSSPGTTAPTQATDELQANAFQLNPALVPTNDPMTTVGADIDIIPNDFPNQNNLSVFKTNLYRSGVGQPLLFGSKVQDAARYCRGLVAAGPRVMADANLPGEINTVNVLGSGKNLSAFMLSRYAASLMLLNCKRFG